MRILLMETDRHAADGAADALEAAGHEVRRCHERDLPAFPCVALCAEGECPLDEGIDVAVTVRAHPYPRPAPLEDGVACALRHHVPLVVAGRSALNPYEPWATGIAEDDDIVTACEEAASRPLHRHSVVARRELFRLLRSHGQPLSGADVVVSRHRQRLLAIVEFRDGTPGAVAEQIAPRLVGALREFDRDALVIDVRIA